ncbi:hypothetical protein BGX23_000492 [Mortierella sp. AD031]|nr:hypothetical protein BGX23_000492 [Mortierella sp. AD031]
MDIVHSLPGRHMQSGVESFTQSHKNSRLLSSTQVILQRAQVSAVHSHPLGACAHQGCPTETHRAFTTDKHTPTST